MMDLSIVIPLYNEDESIDELHSKIVSSLSNSSLNYEIIFIDDGSSDNSWNIIKDVTKRVHNTRAIRFLTNYGKSMALSIDNTFASPINQNPIDVGIDLVIHSATKYLGGHSDILAGSVSGSKEKIEVIKSSGLNFGSNISEYTAWMLERSIKTLKIRVN